jgi:hypothetical protein
MRPTVHRSHLALPLLLLCWPLACTTSSSSPDAGLPDAGLPDAAPDTAPPPDAGLPDAVADVDAGTAACPAPTGAGTTHTRVTGDETWTLAGSPHVVANNLTIPASGSVTVEACAVVQIVDGISISLDGKLVTAGTAGRPVTITAQDPTKPWGWLDATRTTAIPALDLAYTNLSNGGGGSQIGTGEQGAMVRVRGDVAVAPTQGLLKVNHVTLRGSASVGLLVLESGGFATGSTALTVTGSKDEPIAISPLSLSNLPDGDYSGNGVDRIVVTTHERLGVDGQTVDVTMHARNVPYRIGYYGDVAQLTIGPSAASGKSTLRIEAGAELRFAKTFGIDIPTVDANGALLGEIVANGTAAAPITFTSDEAAPLAGDWVGIFLRGNPTTATLLDHVTIQYAGNTSTGVKDFSCGTPGATSPNETMGALAFASDKPVVAQVLTHSVVSDSASNGVDRGWTGAVVDYAASNTFTRVANCAQTLPRPPSPATCPSPLVCGN